MLLRLPAPRDYIPVPAPLRTEQRVREDFGPGNDSSAAPPEPDSAETYRQSKSSCRTQGDDARSRARRTRKSVLGKMPPIKANRKPKREAQLQKNSSRRSHSTGNRNPASANIISLKNALDILHPVLPLAKAPAVGRRSLKRLPDRPAQRLPWRLRKTPSTPLSASRTGTAYGHPSVRTSCALSDANRGS
jgi:hypothetical protein